MRVPIQMIGLATTFFWIFLIVFSVSSMYSIKDLQFEFGEPEASMTADNKMLLSMPITIVNRGYYNIGFFNITTRISNATGSTITRGSTVIPVIRKGENATVAHNMTVDINDLLQSNQNYLFNDTELNIDQIVGLKVAEVIPIQASTNTSVQWGAPLNNFATGQIQCAAYNVTHWRVQVPISFENHAFFDLAGNIRINMYDRSGTLVSCGQSMVDAPQNSFYNGYVEFYVPLANLTPSGHFEVYFETAFFTYGPLVIPYG